MSKILEEYAGVAREYKGLSREEAHQRLLKYGPNELSQGKKASAISMFIGQFKDFMVMVLLAATFISFILGEMADAIAIVIIITMNAILGFIQEYRTEKSLEALKAMSAPHATVVRDGREDIIPAGEIVPGDLVVLEPGNIVPADCTLISGMGLQVDESILTGESVPVEKTASDIPIKKSKLFMGTILTTGRGRAKVEATGMETEMGSIANMIQTAEETGTPLERRLEKIGKQLVYITLVVCALIVLVGTLRGESFYSMLLSGTSLAVAAIPEGLPAIVTVSLAIGVQRMLKRNALIRKLPAVETLGCVNIICSDKTGTLTENKMAVKQIYSNSTVLDVMESDPGRLKSQVIKSPSFKQLFIIGALCNNAEYIGDDLKGDPTETAILALSHKAGITRESQIAYQRIGEIPFDSSRKRMSVICKDSRGEIFLFTKGAPDEVLELCNQKLDDNGLSIMGIDKKKDIIKANKKMAGQALRVLAFAYKKLDHLTASKPDINLEKNLIFVGLEGMMDPPRPETAHAIRSCYKAGIRPVMITGDHKITAMAIAKEIGIRVDEKAVMVGNEIETMDDEHLAGRVSSISVFARVTPRHKYRIIQAFKKDNKNIVAMTGDGVNDAPALKEAHIGIAMGKKGTDVAKEASSMVLLDDDFSTIVEATREGRIIYDNIRKFLRYLLACNLGEILAMAVASFYGMPAPLVPIQILWINLITDGLPALALGIDPPDSDIMNRPPRASGEGIFSRGLGTKILISGILMGGSTVTAFILVMLLSGGDIAKARTVAFATLIITELVYAFESRSEYGSPWEGGLFANKYLAIAVLASLALLPLTIYNPFLSAVLKTHALEFSDWLIVLGFSLAELTVANMIS